MIRTLSILIILSLLNSHLIEFVPFTWAYDLNETIVWHINNNDDPISSNLTPTTLYSGEIKNLSVSPTPPTPLTIYPNLYNDGSNRSQVVVDALFNNNKSSSLSSSSTVTDETDNDGAFMAKIMIVYVIICIIGLCGNMVVILVILRFTKTESVTDIYVLNLAFADVMLITGLAFLITTMYTHHWIFGGLMCKIYMASTSLNQFASSLLLVAMSFDRFLAVCHPIYAQRFRQVGKAKVICLVIWIVCLILMIPIHSSAQSPLKLSFAKVNKELTCTIFWPEYSSFNCESAFTLCSFAIGFATPLMLIAAFYICVVRKLRRTAGGNLASSSRRKGRESTKRRVEFLVVGIICTYTACWLPYWIHQLLLITVTSESPEPYEGFYKGNLIATILSYTNSALNPILYAFLSDNFKRRCSGILESIYSCKLCQALRSLCRQSRPISSRASGEFEIVRVESRQTVVLNESMRLTPSPHAINSRLPDDLIADCDRQAHTRLKPSDARFIKSNMSSDHSSQERECVSSDVDTIVMPGIVSTSINHNII